MAKPNVPLRLTGENGPGPLPWAWSQKNRAPAEPDGTFSGTPRLRLKGRGPSDLRGGNPRTMSKAVLSGVTTGGGQGRDLRPLQRSDVRLREAMSGTPRGRFSQGVLHG